MSCAHRAGAGRLFPKAAQDCASLSHANNLTIGSDFCQALNQRRMLNAETEIQIGECSASIREIP
jgi:hypothetical protein